MIILPIVKYIAIHAAPLSFIEYIENGDKNDSAKYLTGLNVSTEKCAAYDQFKMTFEVCSKEPFYIPEKEQTEGKQKVRLHHYVQSFSPDEYISPEEAHQIGIEWAKRVWGEKYQVIISTHIDKLHIHNHFAVAPYSLERKKWNANWKTLSKCRRISDKVALEHGLKIIENPKHRNTMKYYEWLERKSGNSIKAEIQNKIDHYVLSDEVKSLDDLVEKLRADNYEVKLGKFLTIKPPNYKRDFRADYLDKRYDGYTIKQLEYRIEHKECEISDEAIERLSGIQKEHAIQMKMLQVTVFKYKSKEVLYADLLKSAELLNFLCNNNIRSLESFKSYVNEKDEKYKKVKEEVKQVSERLNYLDEHGAKSDFQIIEDLRLILKEKEQEEEKLLRERDEATKMYKHYLSSHEDTASSSSGEGETPQKEKTEIGINDNSRYER